MVHPGESPAEQELEQSAAAVVLQQEDETDAGEEPKEEDL